MSDYHHSFKREKVERVEGIEPSWPAWKAGTLPLSYTREEDCNIAKVGKFVNGFLTFCGVSR